MFMNLLPKESSGSIFGLVCLIGLLSPSLAHAGFDWTPPPPHVVTQDAPAPAPENMPSNSGPLTPEPDSVVDLPVPTGNIEVAPVVTREPIEVDNTPAPAVVAPAAAVAQPTPAPTPTPAPAPVPAEVVSTPPHPVVSDDVVDGFGKDIPLAIALRDIVPAKYAYVFSPRDIAGVKISWRGGKPWQDVLETAITPYGFNLTVNANDIVISAKQGAEPVASPAASAPMAETTPATQDPVPLAVADNATPQTPAPTMVARRQVEEQPPIRTAVDMQTTRKWQARPGTTLRQTLEAWTEASNVELNWSTPYDYPINNAFYFDGGFAQAVESLLSSYGGESPSPKGRLYPNLPEGPSVLMIN